MSGSVFEIIFGQRHINHNGFVVRHVVDVTSGGVDEYNFPVRSDAVSFMNVAINMILWAHAQAHGVQQFHAACPHTCATQIAIAYRGSMCDENVCVIRNLVPFFQTFLQKKNDWRKLL